MSFCPKQKIIEALIQQYGWSEAVQTLECYAIDLTATNHMEAADLMDQLSEEILKRMQ